MPGPDGKLTVEEREKVREWIAAHSKLTHLMCSVCATNGWTIAEHLVQPLTLGEGQSVQIGGLGYPQAMMTCNNCAHTVLFNAVLMGVVAPSPPTGEKK
jgi:hypothetical protein